MTLKTIAQKDYHNQIAMAIIFAITEFFTRLNLTRDTSLHSFYSLYVVFNDEEVECFEHYEQHSLLIPE